MSTYFLFNEYHVAARQGKNLIQLQPNMLIRFVGVDYIKGKDFQLYKGKSMDLFVQEIFVLAAGGVLGELRTNKGGRPSSFVSQEMSDWSLEEEEGREPEDLTIVGLQYGEVWNWNIYKDPVFGQVEELLSVWEFYYARFEETGVLGAVLDLQRGQWSALCKGWALDIEERITIALDSNFPLHKNYRRLHFELEDVSAIQVKNVYGDDKSWGTLGLFKLLSKAGVARYWRQLHFYDVICMEERPLFVIVPYFDALGIPSDKPAIPSVLTLDGLYDDLDEDKDSVSSSSPGDDISINSHEEPPNRKADGNLETEEEEAAEGENEKDAEAPQIANNAKTCAYYGITPSELSYFAKRGVIEKASTERTKRFLYVLHSSFKPKIREAQRERAANRRRLRPSRSGKSRRKGGVTKTEQGTVASRAASSSLSFPQEKYLVPSVSPSPLGRKIAAEESSQFARAGAAINTRKRLRSQSLYEGSSPPVSFSDQQSCAGDRVESLPSKEQLQLPQSSPASEDMKKTASKEGHLQMSSGMIANTTKERGPEKSKCFEELAQQLERAKSDVRLLKGMLLKATPEDLHTWQGLVSRMKLEE